MVSARYRFVCTLALASALLMVVANAQCVTRDPPLTCEDLVVNISAYGAPASGLLIEDYTCGTLGFIGCHADGCTPDTFFCIDNADGISFGTNAEFEGAEGPPLRVILGSLPFPDEFINCATDDNPSQVLDAPDEMADATVLCNQLGYTTAAVTAETTSLCPDASILEGECWSSEFAFSAGHGRDFTCSNDCSLTGVEQDCSDCPTMAPSESPSGSPSAASESPSGSPSAASESPSGSPSGSQSGSPSGSPVYVLASGSPSISPSGSAVVSTTESDSESESGSGSDSGSDSVDNAVSAADRSNELSPQNASLSVASILNVDYVIDIGSSTTLQVFAMLLLFMIVNVLICCCYHYNHKT